MIKRFIRKINAHISINIMLNTMSMFAISAQSDSIPTGSYLCDNGYEIKIDRDLSVLVTNSNIEEAETEENYVLENGKLIKLDNSRSYKMENIDNYGGFYIGEYYNNNKRLVGHYILHDYPYLYYSSLKSLPGIESHLVSGYTCVNTDYSGDRTPNYKPILNLVFSLQPDNLYYLAFEDSINTYDDDIDFTFTSNIGSLNYLFDLRTNALTNITVKVDDGKNKYNVPVICQSEYNKIKHLSNLEKRNALSITDDDSGYFVVANRLNPARTRVVNKKFGRKVEGQVMPFELLKLED